VSQRLQCVAVCRSVVLVPHCAQSLVPHCAQLHIARSLYPGLQTLSMCVRARVYTHGESACINTHIHIYICVYVCTHISRCTMIFVNTHVQAHHPKLLLLRVTNQLYGTPTMCMGQLYTWDTIDVYNTPTMCMRQLCTWDTIHVYGTPTTYMSHKQYQPICARPLRTRISSDSDLWPPASTVTLICPPRAPMPPPTPADVFES